MRAILIAALFICLVFTANAFAAFSQTRQIDLVFDDDDPTVWQQYLSSEEKILPFAAIAVKMADDGGLDSVTAGIKNSMAGLEKENLSSNDKATLLAFIWVASIQGAMLQQIDPFPNPAYQEVIDAGMNYSGERCGIPDLKECMLLTTKTIVIAQKESK